MESDLNESHGDTGYDVFNDVMAMTFFVAQLRAEGYIVDVSRTASGAWLVEWFR